jgi:predicted metalloprotease
MRWRGQRQSTNVEDRRRMSPGVAVGGGLGTLLIVGLVLLMGGDPSVLLQQGPPGGSTAPATAEEEELAQFVSTVLADTEDVWKEQFRRIGRTYEEPTLVLFRGRVQSACGFASAAVGPFYCPADRKVYVDLAFYDELRRRFGAPGDFAQAYVVAHEVGHHVQNLLGVSERVHREQERTGEVEANRLSVRLELQADFLAGVWAHHAQRTRQILEEGDVEEALRAANAIGDDALQRKAQGHVVPDSFTHGTSAQREAWFRHGLETGDLAQGDTFDEAHFARVGPR